MHRLEGFTAIVECDNLSLSLTISLKRQPASYRQLAGKLPTQRRKRLFPCHAVNRQTGSVLELTNRRLGACAEKAGEAAGIKAGADQQALQYARDVALPASADIKHRCLGERSEYPVNHQTGAALTI